MPPSLLRLAKALKIWVTGFRRGTSTTLTIIQLTQQDADKLMKSLDQNETYYRNFYEAFHGERKPEGDRSLLWALDKEERSYYLVESYLFGINFKPSNQISISSLARVLHATPSEKCATCLKFLLQETLFPICVAQRKYINAVLTEKGKTVFTDLKKDLRGVQIEAFDGHYYPARITCEENCS